MSQVLGGIQQAVKIRKEGRMETENFLSASVVKIR